MAPSKKDCCSWLVWALLSFASVGLRGQEAGSADEPQPIDNAEFIGVPTTARITRRFEIYDPHTVEDLRAVKAMGFDQVMLDRAPLHVAATELGLDVVIANWWTPSTSQETIDQSMALARQVAPGKLIAISLMDEPERNSPETPFGFYVDLYRQLRPKLVDALSDVRLEISYWGPLRSWDQRYYDYFSYLYEAADAMRIMPYPDLHEDALNEVYLMLQRSRRAMRLADVEVPHVVILQTWVLPPEPKLPTIDELRVMAYQAMLGGAETLSFFEYKPEVWTQTTGFTEAFSGLMQELREFSDRLAAAQIESTLCDNGILEAIAVWPSGHSERIRVNTNRFPAEGLQALEIHDSSRPSTQRAQSTADLDGSHCDRVRIPQSTIYCPPKVCLRTVGRRRGLFSSTCARVAQPRRFAVNIRRR